MSERFAFDTTRRGVVDNCCRRPHLWYLRGVTNKMGVCLLLRLLVGLRGVLHPRHVAVFTVNFIRPPTVGVAIWIARV